MTDSPTNPRAEKAAAKAHRKAMRPWYRKKRFIALGVIALIVIISVATHSGGSATTTTAAGPVATTTAAASPSPAGSSTAAATAATTTAAGVTAQAAGNAAEDVTVTSCAASGPASLGLYQAQLTIKNSTSDSASYTVTVSANDAAGNRVGELNGFANAIAPGQSATVQAAGTVTGAAKSCAVASATRF